MAPVTSSSLKDTRALSTRAVLVTVLLAVVVTLTGTSLLLVWRQIRRQVTADLSTDLQRSRRAFHNAETEGFGALDREAALLADLPSLKALLTTDDDRTIQDAAVDFWRTSGNGLFSLAGPDGRVRTIYAASQQDKAFLASDLRNAVQRLGRGYLLSQGRLYRYAAHPVSFGSAASGTLLGTVITGYQVNASYLAQMLTSIDADVAFISDGKMLESSSRVTTPDVLEQLQLAQTRSEPVKITLNGEPHLATTNDLSARANVPLQVIFYRSLLPAELEIRAIAKQLLLLGAVIILLGSLLMLVVARRLTGPLEMLTQRVNAFGETSIAKHGSERLEGTQEVRQLARDFDLMRTRIEESNSARLESERLATIGSMATSVSHDLRHHLASIYANAEFLAGPEVSEDERAEFFHDIQAAVMATTEMLESLTIFSRTGQAARHLPQQIGPLLERSIAQVRAHPAAANVTLTTLGTQIEAPVIVDGKQMERALFNLLLNGCQSRRPPDRDCIVTAIVQVQNGTVSVLVQDNGTGIPAAVQHTLFDPFVSSGKQNGTGLGLTLARRIAEDHYGQVDLLVSSFAETTFQLRLPLFREELSHQPVWAQN